MSEVRLTQSERQALVAAEHMTQSGCACEPIRDVVEAIIAARMAAVEALADEWERRFLATLDRLNRVEALVKAAEHRERTSLSRTFDGGTFGAKVDAAHLRAALTAAPGSEDRQAGRALRGPQSPAAGTGAGE